MPKPKSKSKPKLYQSPLTTTEIKTCRALWDVVLRAQELFPKSSLVMAQVVRIRLDVFYRWRATAVLLAANRGVDIETERDNYATPSAHLLVLTTAHALSLWLDAARQSGDFPEEFSRANLAHWEKCMTDVRRLRLPLEPGPTTQTITSLRDAEQVVDRWVLRVALPRLRRPDAVLRFANPLPANEFYVREMQAHLHPFPAPRVAAKTRHGGSHTDEDDDKKEEISDIEHETESLLDNILVILATVETDRADKFTISNDELIEKFHRMQGILREVAANLFSFRMLQKENPKISSHVVLSDSSFPFKDTVLEIMSTLELLQMNFSIADNRLKTTEKKIKDDFPDYESTSTLSFHMTRLWPVQIPKAEELKRLRNEKKKWEDIKANICLRLESLLIQISEENTTTAIKIHGIRGTSEISTYDPARELKTQIYLDKYGKAALGRAFLSLAKSNAQKEKLTEMLENERIRAIVAEREWNKLKQDQQLRDRYGTHLQTATQLKDAEEQLEKAQKEINRYKTNELTSNAMMKQLKKERPYIQKELISRLHLSEERVTIYENLCEMILINLQDLKFMLQERKITEPNEKIKEIMTEQVEPFHAVLPSESLDGTGKNITLFLHKRTLARVDRAVEAGLEKDHSFGERMKDPENGSQTDKVATFMNENNLLVELRTLIVGTIETLRANRQQINSSKYTIEIITEENDNQKEQIQKFKKSKNDLELQLQATDAELTKLKTSREAELQELRENHLAEWARMDEEIRNANIEIQNIFLQKEQEVQTKQEIQERLELLQGTYEKTVQQLETLGQELNITQEQLSAVHRDLSNTRGQLRNTRGQLRNTRGQLRNTRGKIRNLRGQLTNTQDQLTNTQDQVTNTQDQLTNTQDQLTNTQLDFTFARDLIAQQGNEILTLQQSIAEKEYLLTEITNVSKQFHEETAIVRYADLLKHSVTRKVTGSTTGNDLVDAVMNMMTFVHPGPMDDEKYDAVLLKKMMEFSKLRMVDRAPYLMPLRMTMKTVDVNVFQNEHRMDAYIRKLPDATVGDKIFMRIYAVMFAADGFWSNKVVRVLAKIRRFFGSLWRRRKDQRTRRIAVATKSPGNDRVR